MTWQALCQAGILPRDGSFLRRSNRGAQRPAWRIQQRLPMELSKGSILNLAPHVTIVLIGALHWRAGEFFSLSGRKNFSVAFSWVWRTPPWRLPQIPRDPTLAPLGYT